jgi:hypothetical protein
MLEHHAHLLPMEVDVAAFVSDIDAIEQNLPTRRDLQQIEASQKCGLTRAGRADYDDNLAETPSSALMADAPVKCFFRSWT